MKNLYTTLLAIIAFSITANAQNTWTQKAAFGGSARTKATGFSIGAKGYIGTGYEWNGPNKKDFWEWDQATNVWTQKADFGGTARRNAVGFSIGSKGYIGTGEDSTGKKKDFWEWDQATNVWVQKADFGGTARNYAVGFTMGAKGYIGTGDDGNSGGTLDFWEWDQATNVWVQKADYGGHSTWGASGFSIGTKGYIGLGYGISNDFFEWDQATNVWTRKANFPGSPRNSASSFSIGTKGYIGIGYNIASDDFWEYNQTNDVWVQKANFGGTARKDAVGFSIGSKGYFGTGEYLTGSYSTDFWEYSQDNTCVGFAATVTAGGATTFCQGNNVTLSSIQHGSPFVFQWLLNSSQVSTDSVYTASASGNYSLIVDSLGCFDTSNVITVTVNSLPAVSLDSIPLFINYYASPLLLTGNPIGGAFTGNGITGNSFNPNSAGLGVKTITYNYTNGNSCSSSATISTIVYDTTGIICTSYDTIYISVTDTLIINTVLTGITPPNNINTIKIYPNPASTHIYIDNGNFASMSGYTIRIDNDLSQTVFTSLVNQQQFYVDLSSWSGNGIYFVYIIDNFGSTIDIRKIVLQ